MDLAVHLPFNEEGRIAGLFGQAERTRQSVRMCVAAVKLRDFGYEMYGKVQIFRILFDRIVPSS